MRCEQLNAKIQHRWKRKKVDILVKKRLTNGDNLDEKVVKKAFFSIFQIPWNYLTIHGPNFRHHHKLSESHLIHHTVRCEQLKEKIQHRVKRKNSIFSFKKLLVNGNNLDENVVKTFFQFFKLAKYA